jgi:hypothetical protein
MGPKMRLNDEQNEKVKKYLNEKWPEPQACSVCKKVDWKFSDKLYALTEYDPEYLSFERYKLPLIALVCTNCGNTILFYEKYIGVLEGRE